MTSYLECPVCPEEIEVSPEDEDASLSEMVYHLQGEHSDQNTNKLLARVRLTKR